VTLHDPKGQDGPTYLVSIRGINKMKIKI